MRKAFLVCVVLLTLGANTWAQNETDSVRIRGKIILDFDELDSPKPFSGAGLFIISVIRGYLHILDTATANEQGEFTFTMPKGEYTVGLWVNQYYRNYAILLEDSNHKQIDAQSDVYLGECTPVVKDYIRILDNVMQEMKIDGVKVSASY